jgi:hypothetical protein
MVVFIAYQSRNPDTFKDAEAVVAAAQIPYWIHRTASGKQLRVKVWEQVEAVQTLLREAGIMRAKK